MSTQDAERPGNIRAAQLEETLKRARDSDADHFDSRAKVSDLRFLRLDALREQLFKAVEGEELVDTFLTMRAIPGDPPRLIVDESSHIVMEPDPRTYTFVHDGPEARKVLLESEDKAEVETKVTEYVAHRILELKRLSPLPVDAKKTHKSGRIGGLALLMFWLAGVAMGAAAMYAYLNPEAVQTLLQSLQR